MQYVIRHSQVNGNPTMTAPPHNDAALASAGRTYVNRYLAQAGGLREAAWGFWQKSLPSLFRWHKVSAARIAALFLRLILLSGAALFPLMARKATADQDKPGDATALLSDWTNLDVALGCIALVLVFVPRVLDFFFSDEKQSTLSAFDELAAAITKMPQLDGHGAGRDADADTAIDGALDCVLRGLRDEMAHLVGDLGPGSTPEVTLLQFANLEGTEMMVRSRTSSTDACMRPVPSTRFLAYQVAIQGNPLIENDFLSRRNPYPKNRVTVLGNPPVTYRSILFLPITWSKRVEEPNGTDHGQSSVIDMVMGIVCIRCNAPFRFWRWGDHRRSGGAFGTVAYSRASPYIALVTRLLEPFAHKVEIK